MSLPPQEAENLDASASVARVSRAVAWNGIVSIVATAFGMAASILTVRLLTLTEYGAFVVASNYLRYAAILMLFTLDAALHRYVPEYRFRGDRAGLKDLLSKVIRVHLTIWALLVIATLVGAPWLSRLNNTDLNALMLTGIAVTLPSVVYVSLQAVLTAFYEVRIQAIGFAIGGVLQLVCLWFLVGVLKLGGPGAMLGQLGMSGTLLLLFGYWLRKLPWPGQVSPFQPIHLKRLLKFSLPFVINAVAGAVFLRQSEVFFLQPFHGAEETALYSYGYTLSQRFLEFVPAMLYGVGNVLASSAFLQGRDYLAKVMGIYWRVTSIVITAVSVGGFVLADRLIVLLFGAKAAPAGWIASLLFITQAIIIFVNPYNFVMRAEEKTWLGFWLSPPAAAISLGCSYLLIPPYGIEGAVAATSLSFALVTLFQFVVFRRKFPYLRMPLSYIFRCYAASSLMVLAWPIKQWAPGTAGLVAGVVASVALWLSGARLFRLVGDEEADLIRRARLPGSSLVLRLLTR
ncbi:MAG: hypothetical protein ACUVSM_01410 [Armatimonadota bacterium]